MTSIYDQHDVAFRNVSAYVILKDNELVARVSFKFPKDGAGRLYAYVHWLGTQMVRGYAGGYGYDKASAAVASAAKRMPMKVSIDPAEDNYVRADSLPEYHKFLYELLEDGGEYWDNRLRKAGFTVIQAV